MVKVLIWELAHPAVIITASVVWFGGFLVGRISKAS